MAQIKEDEGDVTGAADIIQELQVETYGSMKKQEKVELILEQMRLCLAKKDFIRTQIISKKINTKFFDEDKTEIQQLKLKYYKLEYYVFILLSKYLIMMFLQIDDRVRRT